MTTIPVGWAIVSKRPGTFEDYSLLAASRTPYSPQQLTKVVLATTPGNSPPAHVPPPAALPWVWFVPTEIEQTLYLQVTLRDWTDDRDGADRRIAVNRFFCVPLDEFVRTGCGFGELHAAVEAAQLVANAGEPHDSSPVPIEPPAPARHDGEHRELYIHAATALFTGSVSLLGDHTDIASRLAVLDRIAQWLPAGAKAWLSASVWSDSATKNAFALSFTRPEAARDAVLDLRAGTWHGPAPTAAAVEYRRLLVSLCAKYGADAVVEHLAGLDDLRLRDIDAALWRLTELDLPDIVHAAAVAGRMDPADLRRLNERGMTKSLDRTRASTVLAAYFSVASVEDLLRDRELLTALAELVDRDVPVEAMARLLTRSPSARTIADLAEFASRGDAAPAFAAALSRADERVGTLFTAPETATAIVNLAHTDPDWARELGPLIAVSRPRSAAIAAIVFSAGGPLNQLWFEALEKTAPPNSTWSAISRVFRRAWQAQGRDFADADIEALWHVDSDLVRILLQATVDRHPEALDAVVEVTVAVLGGYAVGQLPEAILKALTRIPASDERRQARIDVILYRQNANPVHALPSGLEYRRTLVDIAARLLDTERERLLYAIVHRLGDGWSQRGAEAVLNVLWDLSHRTDQPTARVLAASAIAKEMTAHGSRFLDIPALGRWLAELEGEPTTHRVVMVIRIRNLAPDQPIGDVADLLARGHDAGIEDARLVAELRGSGWRASAPGWLALATRVTALRAQPGARDSYSTGLALITAELDKFDRTGDERSRTALWHFALAQLELTARTLDAFTTPAGEAAASRPIDRVLDRLGDTLESRQGRQPSRVRAIINHILPAGGRDADGKR